MEKGFALGRLDNSKIDYNNSKLFSTEIHCSIYTIFYLQKIAK